MRKKPRKAHFESPKKLNRNQQGDVLTFPVEAVEPLVLLDVADAPLLVAKPLSTVVSEME